MAKKKSPYQKRNETLLKMGFSSYKEYLKSDLWKVIRGRVLRRAKGKCEVCGGIATQVHHRTYQRSTLEGKWLDFMTAVCGTCHQEAEIQNGCKTTMRVAGRTMQQKAKSLGLALPRVCFNCNKPTKPGLKLCGCCIRNGIQLPKHLV